MRYSIIFLTALALFIARPVASQQLARQLTLEEIIEIAQTQSPDALSAKNRFLKGFWEMRTSKATLLPRLSLDGTLPSYQRSIDKITLDDGTDAFKERALSSAELELSLSKNIALTGGQVYMKSNLQRIDYLAGSTPTAWLSNPLIVGYSQTIFGYNQFKWSKKIDPIKYNEAKRGYLADIEQISITATNYFFNMLVSQFQKKIALQNVANYDTLYKIGVGRYNLGKIPENELLQLELSLLQAQASVENTNLDLEDKMFKLKSYLRIKDDQPIELISPEENVSFFEIPVEEAIQLANLNNSEALAFERRLLEADQAVNYARHTDRFNATLFAQFGLTQSSEEFDQVYVNPQDQQQVSLGIHVPILDWGMARGRIKIAESDREIQRTAVEQERIDFDQSVYLQVMNFKMQQRQLTISAKADTVAQKGYDISKQRYLIGKIDIIDLTTAQINGDNARISYARSLQDYWINYFQIRKLTLFDFMKKEEIGIDFEKLR